MKSKIISSSLLIAGFLIGATALSTFAAWSTPVCNPGDAEGPGACNTEAPLHVGSTLQSKLGVLSLNTNGVGLYGLQVANGIKLIDAEMLAETPKNPNNMVLTSNETGIGTWKSIGSSVSGMRAFTSNSTWTVPPGAKFAKISLVGAGGRSSVYLSGGYTHTYSPGKMVMSIVSLSGVTSISAVVGLADFNPAPGTHAGGNSSVTLNSSGQTITAAGGLSSSASTGGDFSSDGPYLSYGQSQKFEVSSPLQHGLVHIEWY